jgi:hypothetical protein
VVYSYAPGRGHTHANTLLGGYRGILQCDGYAAYKKFAGSKSAGTSVTLAFCWSHVRRGFYDLAKAKAPIAMEALQRIAALYEIEARVRGKSANDRLAVRQAESKPLVTELRIWFEAQIAKLPARGPTAEAIRYALNHWEGLERFLDDGRIELDNNSVERSMRPVALSRNYAHPRIMRTSPFRRRVEANTAGDFRHRRGGHNSEALKEAHQRVRRPVTRVSGFDRLQSVECTLFH